ncbi:MAG: hypothetical protein ACI4L8_07860 [Candidatus Fimadaptatus sp.]
MKHIITLIALLLALACPLLAAAQPDAPELLDVTDAFAWHEIEGEEVDPDTIYGNAAYLELLRSLAVQPETVCEGALMRFEAVEALATDDLTALTWRATNVSDHLLYVRSNELRATFSGTEYDLCGGCYWKNYIIRPGETVNARFNGVLWEHCEPGEGAFELSMSIYAIAADAIPGDYYTDATGLYAGGEFYPEDEGALSLEEELTFSVPLTMGASDVLSALPDGRPLERDIGRYTLRVTRADMNAASTAIEYERIYPTEADARADSPTGSSFWEYEYLSGDDSRWIHAAFGDIPDDPVELSDGRWGWRISYKVYYMYSRPDTVIMRPRYFEDGAGYQPTGSGEEVVLSFSAADA